MTRLSYKKSLAARILFVSAVFGFISIVGGGLYETINIYPAMIDGAPKSLRVFQGEHAIKLHPFWIVVHSFSELALLGLLALLWKYDEQVRVLLLKGLALHIFLRLVTFAYFAPTIIDILAAPYAEVVDPQMNDRLTVWLILSSLRTPASIVVAVYVMKARRLFQLRDDLERWGRQLRG